MAIYKLNSKKKKQGQHNVKKITGFSLIGAASVIFFFATTGLLGFMQFFFLGIFGVFVWPLCLAMFVVGLALLNNRKYVMSKRYTICLILSILFFLCILQLAIVPYQKGVGFWQYLGSHYMQNWTPGGILIGFFTTIVLFIVGTSLPAAYIIFSLALVLCLALLADSLKFLKKQKAESEPVSVQIRDKDKQEQIYVKPQPKPAETTAQNIVLEGNLKEQEIKETQKPLTARQMLGLDKKRNSAYEYASQQKSEQPKPQKKVEEKPKSLKEILLTPPQVDIDEYFKNVRTPQNQPQTEKTAQEAPSKEVVENAFKELKTEEINPSEVYHEDEFKMESRPQIVRNLPEVKSQELVAQADDILRSAIEEEKQENPDIYENAQPAPTPTAEQNVLDRLPERDNTGSFLRRDSLMGGRMNLRGENLSQEDKDANDAFNRNYDSISIRNGSLRETPEIPPEEEEVYEPYEYFKPSVDFITTKSVDLSTLNESVAEKRVLLENSLETFGVPAKVQGVVVGPAVTRYEIAMPPGVSVTKIKSRVDDIALSIAAEGSIRIEAPIPGRSVVGIEVPNAKVATVSLKDIINSREFMSASSPLTFALGKDITGNIICCNMQKLTHLLVAGSTGSGKSVCLNAIILSIIYKASPEDVKIVLIDPKRVEFSNYEALPHLIMPKIVCDTQMAINTLSWAVDEMERRFEVLGNARVKNIDEYNQTQDVLEGKVRKMPFIVVIVDELADLMMTGKKEVEEKIMRLAQKARAAGIHLILATQRPSVDVITGVIKSNFPSRISFAVASAFDSNTILDRVGAEKLLGKGDMLYFPNGAKDPVRVQGCFISTAEINNIVDFTRDNNKPIFDKSIQDKIENPNKGNGNGEGVGYNNEMDPLLPQALKVSIDCGQASATMIRRKFAIGYPRAARIIDQMEAAGYISTADGPKGRSVYISEDEFKTLFGDVD